MFVTTLVSFPPVAAGHDVPVIRSRSLWNVRAFTGDTRGVSRYGRPRVEVTARLLVANSCTSVLKTAWLSRASPSRAS
jgi:hypothetical protein